jgi:hypothetical protein
VIKFLIFISLFFVSVVVLCSCIVEISAEEYKNKNYGFKLQYPDDWEVNKDIQPTISPETAKLLNNEVQKEAYPDFNHFRILQIVPDVEMDGYESTIFGDPVFSITIYPNMSNLEKVREYDIFYNIYQNDLSDDYINPSDKIIESISKVDKNGLPIYVIITKKLDPIDKTVIFDFTYLLWNNNTGYGITYYVGSQLAKAYTTDFQNLISSFEFLN